MTENTKELGFSKTKLDFLMEQLLLLGTKEERATDSELQVKQVVISGILNGTIFFTPLNSSDGAGLLKSLRKKMNAYSKSRCKLYNSVSK